MHVILHLELGDIIPATSTYQRHMPNVLALLADHLEKTFQRPVTRASERHVPILGETRQTNSIISAGLQFLLSL